MMLPSVPACAHAHSVAGPQRTSTPTNPTATSLHALSRAMRPPLFLIDVFGHCLQVIDNLFDRFFTQLRFWKGGHAARAAPDDVACLRIAPPERDQRRGFFAVALRTVTAT